MKPFEHYAAITNYIALFSIVGPHLGGLQKLKKLELSGNNICHPKVCIVHYYATSPLH
jgi:hypothetical protein